MGCGGRRPVGLTRPTGYLAGVFWQRLMKVGHRMVVTFKSIMDAMGADPEFAKRLAAHTPQPDDPKTSAEIANLCQFIGTYIVVFQDIEAKLDQIISLAIGLERWHVSQNVLSFLSHVQKIEFVQNTLQSSALADGDPIYAEWLAHFDKLVQQLKEEATRRNKIVHSLYLFDFMDIGEPPIRSKKRRKRGEVGLDQEPMDAAFIASVTSHVAELVFDLGMALVQLRHWSDKLATARRTAT